MKCIFGPISKVLRRRWSEELWYPPADAKSDDTRFDITDTGFVVRGRHGEVAFSDEQVVGLSVSGKLIEVTENSATCLREAHIRLTGDELLEERTIAVKGSFLADDDDPLQPFLDRLEDKLIDRGRQVWAEQRLIETQSWRLDGALFQYNGAERPQEVLLSKLMAVEQVGDELCLWTSDGDRPTVRVPQDVENFSVLVALLESIISDRLSQNLHPFGRELLRIENGTRTIPRFVFIALGFSSVFVACWLFAAICWLFGDWPRWCQVAALVGAAVTAVAIGLHLIVARLILYEGALVFESSGRRRVFQTDQIDRVDCRQTRCFHSGFFSSTQYDVTVCPAPSAGIRRFKFSWSEPTVKSARLDFLRHRFDQVATEVPVVPA